MTYNYTCITNIDYNQLCNFLNRPLYNFYNYYVYIMAHIIYIRLLYNYIVDIIIEKLLVYTLV